MRGIALLALTALVVGGLVGSAHAAGILLNDGLSHTVSDEFYASDELHVRNVGCGTAGTFEQLTEACATPGAATDLLLTSGGTLYAARSDDSSSITIDGGTLPGGADGWGTSSIHLLAGDVGGLVAHETSSLAVSGGTVTFSVAVYDDALGHMSGGSVGRDFQAVGASTAVISGGAVAGRVTSQDMCSVMITGGTQAGTLRPDGTSSVTIVGSGFTVDGSPVPYGPLAATTGTLAGTLDSGEALPGTLFFQGQPLGTGRILLASSAVPPAASEDVLVSWGGPYVIDDWTYAHDALFVRNLGCGTPADPQAACGAPGAATALELAAGGAAGAVTVRDASVLTLAGGLVGTDVEVRDASGLDISDGLVGGRLSAHDDSTLTISGGTIQFELTANGAAAVDLSGGAVKRFSTIGGRASLNATGGTLWRGLAATGSSTVTMGGASIGPGPLAAHEMSAVTLTGGPLHSGFSLFSSGSATLTIVGSGFAIDGVPVGYGPVAAARGRLTGTLDSGDAIDNNFSQGSLTLAPGRIVLAAAADPPPPVGDVLLNDGGAHLASDWGSSRSTLYVRSAGCGSPQDPSAPCASPGAASDLQIVSDAGVGAVVVRDGASVGLSGGIVGRGIEAHESAAVTIEGGIVGVGVETHDSSSLTLNGGRLQGIVNARNSSSVSIGGGWVQGLTTHDSSALEITAGQVRKLDARGTSTVLISGGMLTFGLFTYDAASVLFSGGTVNDVTELSDASTLTISGGFFDDDVIAYETASITVDGGTLSYDLDGYGSSTLTLRGVTQGSSFSLSVYDTAALTIHGSGFAVDGGAVGYGPLAATGGQLTGTLESGDPLDAGFYRDTGASITLVPEPARALSQAAVLLCLGALASRRRGGA